MSNCAGISEAVESTNLSSEVGSSSLGDLEDDGGLGITGSLEGSNNGGGGGNVLWPRLDFYNVRSKVDGDWTHDGGDGELVLTGVLEQLENRSVP